VHGDLLGDKKAAAQMAESSHPSEPPARTRSTIAPFGILQCGDSVSLLDDVFPVPLHNFGPDTLDRLRVDGTPEGLLLELKEQWRMESVSKAVCAFANAFGGLLIIGAAQATDGSIAAYPGLDSGREWALLVKDAIIGHVSPLPAWGVIVVENPDDPDRVVIVVRTQASARTPHILTSSGVIYQRSPAGSDPVRDAATVRDLAERGRSGSSWIDIRREEVRRIVPVRHPDTHQDHWTLELVSVPSPPVEAPNITLLTWTGYQTARDVFQGALLSQVRPERLLEDGVLLRTGTADVALFTDGAAYLHAVLDGEPELAVSPELVRTLTRELVAGQARLRPPVWQAAVWIRVGCIAGRRVQDNFRGLSLELSERVLQGDAWIVQQELTGTDTGALERDTEAIRRRLWRAVGAPGFEPE
jgi:Putative DNA-binding domain